jgi:hypothetical protein
LLEFSNLLLASKFKPLALDASLELFLSLYQPPILEGDRTVLSTEAHGDWIALFCLVSTDPIERVLIGFEVERIYDLPDLIHYFFRRLINKDFFADLLAHGLFYRSDGGSEECDLLKFSI